MSYPDRENNLPQVLKAPVRQELDLFGRARRDADPTEIENALKRARNFPPQPNVFWVDGGKISPYIEPNPTLGRRRRHR